MGKGLGVLLLILGFVAMYFYITNYSLTIPTLTIGDFGYWLFYGAVILIILGLLWIIFSRSKPPRY